VDIEPGHESDELTELGTGPSRPVPAFVEAEAHREAVVLASWLRRNAENARLVRVAGTWAMPAGVGPPGRFRPRE
jgi:hypothetical protein